MLKKGVVTCDDCKKRQWIGRKGIEWQSWWVVDRWADATMVKKKWVVQQESLIYHRCRKCDRKYALEMQIMPDKPRKRKS